VGEYHGNFYLLTAVYLALTLLYGTLAVVSTIGVLDLYHRDDRKPVPKWLRNLICRFKSNAPVNAAPDTVVTTDVTRRNSMAKPPLEDEPEEDSSSMTSEVTWKEVARVLDTFLLRLFLAVVVITSMVCLSLMAHSY
jgi:hypothetical protein